ncbi:MAG: glycosyltransferase family 2 protein [Candidatus Aegiribacteria sp.]|nr:glycosyltransferase family 2 protein [Candidatus Aegiribacteria sp.]
MNKNITVVIVTWNSSALLPKLAETLNELKPICDVVVSDNSSTDKTCEVLKETLPWVTVLKNRENGGFGYGNNRALEICETPFVLFLNTDARISVSSLEALLEILERNKSAAAVQPLIRLWGWPLVTLSAGTSMTEFARGYDYDFMHFQPSPRCEIIEVPAVTAAVSLFRKEALQEAGGFDERIFMYFEDTDLCLRLRERGYKFLLAQSVEAEHIMGGSSSRGIAEKWELESSAYLARKYLGGEKCHLPQHWKNMEWKTRISLMLNRKHWFWRIPAVHKAEKLAVRHIELPDSVLQDIIAPRPLRMPFKRTADNDRSYMGNDVISGPGWLDGRIDNGFGCMQVPAGAGSLIFMASSSNISGSLALWSQNGVITRKFLRIAERTGFTAVIDEGITHLYLVPDRRKQRIEIDNVNYTS